MIRAILRLLLCLMFGVALLIVPPSAEASALVTVRGRIIDESGNPLAGVTVHIVDWQYNGGVGIASAKTDTEGRYRVRYGLIDHPVDYIDVYVRGFYLEEHPIFGLPGRTYTVDLVMRRPPTVTGHVVDEAGASIDSGTVTFLNTVPGGDCPGGVTYDDGYICDEYLFGAGINGGEFEVRLWGGALFSMEIKASGFQTKVIHGVSPGSDVEITLLPGDSAVTAVTVSGVVEDAEGVPVVGADVVATDPDTKRESSYNLNPDVALATTDANGFYSLSFDPHSIDNIERPLMVEVDTPDGSVAWPAGEISVDRPYEAGMEVTADIRLGPAGTIVGEVRDENGNLLPGVTVCCGLGSASATTDASGRYALAVLPGHGRVHVVGAPCGGGCRRYSEYVAQPGVETTVNISLELIDEDHDEAPPEPDITRPAPPQNVRAVRIQPTRVKFRFRPAYSGGRPITLFEASCVGWHNQAPEQRARGQESPLVVDGLRPGRRYVCRVRARNTLGWSRWTNSGWLETDSR